MVYESSTYTVDDWTFRSFNDGTEQWRFHQLGPFAAVNLERVVGPKSRRKRWRIADRRPRNDDYDLKYPPAIGKPFKDIETAKVAYLVMLAAGLLDPIAG